MIVLRRLVDWKQPVFVAVLIFAMIVVFEVVGSEFFVVGAFRIFVWFFPADFVVLLGIAIYWRERRKRR